MTMIAKKSADAYMLRFPAGLRDRLKERTAISGRSLNTEIIAAIERQLDADDRLTDIERRLAKLEKHSRFVE